MPGLLPLRLLLFRPVGGGQTEDFKTPEAAHSAGRLLLRMELAELDYRRQLLYLVDAGYTPREVSGWFGISQPPVQSALSAADKVAMPTEGFSGATPADFSDGYYVGLIDRPQLIDELTRFPFVSGATSDGDGSLVVAPPRTWAEVSDARRRSLIGRDL